MKDKKVLITYHSFSGNTKEVAEMVGQLLESKGEGVSVEYYAIPRHRQSAVIDLDGFDAVLVGSFTWGKGEVPDGVKKFYIDHIEPLRATRIFYYGTGDTQFGGDDLFCSALDVLNSKVASNFPILKIEQSPRGSQEKTVADWTEKLLQVL